MDRHALSPRQKAEGSGVRVRVRVRGRQKAEGSEEHRSGVEVFDLIF